jgi:hypothetical protein
MNRQQILLALALAEAGIPVRVGQFEERLLLQKAVYLLQEAGVHLGYRYRWYLRGPYSTDLASDVFFLASQGASVEQELASWQLDSESKAHIGRLKTLFSGQALGELVKRLELLASVLYLVRTHQVRAGAPRRISEILKANNKPFGQGDVLGALRQLRGYGFAC